MDSSYTDGGKSHSVLLRQSSSKALKAMTSRCGCCLHRRLGAHWRFWPRHNQCFALACLLWGFNVGVLLVFTRLEQRLSTGVLQVHGLRLSVRRRSGLSAGCRRRYRRCSCMAGVVPRQEVS